jgi:hypothetical protein
MTPGRRDRLPKARPEKRKRRILDVGSEQTRLHRKIAKLLGSVEGSKPMRAEKARRAVRLRVSSDRARRRVR